MNDYIQSSSIPSIFEIVFPIITQTDFEWNWKWRRRWKVKIRIKSIKYMYMGNRHVPLDITDTWYMACGCGEYFVVFFLFMLLSCFRCFSALVFGRYTVNCNQYLKFEFIHSIHIIVTLCNEHCVNISNSEYVLHCNLWWNQKWRCINTP